MKPMTGKTVFITRGTGGIDKAAAAGLASMGARLGITGRDRARAEWAATDIEAESGNPAVDVFVADLSPRAEVRRMAGEALATYPRLDMLVNNVGWFWSHRHTTADGLGHTFALNHLAPFFVDQPPAGTAHGLRAGSCRDGGFRSPVDGDDRLRRPDGRSTLHTMSSLNWGEG